MDTDRPPQVIDLGSGETLESLDLPERRGTKPPDLGPIGIMPMPVSTSGNNDDDDEDEFEDETLSERLWGLTEMFPEPVRKATASVTDFSVSSVKFLYQLSRAGLWVVASSATILALPIMFESERAQMEEQHLQQQRQILLGPNAAISGAGGGGMMPGGMMPGGMPPMPPQPAK